MSSQEREYTIEELQAMTGEERLRITMRMTEEIRRGIGTLSRGAPRLCRLGGKAGASPVVVCTGAGAVRRRGSDEGVW
jgi:hypothetical protein